MLSIGVAVPCYGPHVAKLPVLLQSIAAQTVLPQHVVIRSSATRESDVEAFRHGWPFPIEIIVRPERCNAAQNRNAAVRALTTDLVSFIDADDTMHPQRLEIVRHVAETTRADVVLHGCLSPPSAEYLAPYRTLDPPWPFSLNASGEKAPRYQTHYQPVNGHVTVSRHLAHAVMQPENLTFERREDSEFVDVLIGTKGVTSAFIDLGLTKYESAGRWLDAPAGSGTYALGATGSMLRTAMAMPVVRRARPRVQAFWRKLPLSIRQRFLK